MTVKHTYDPAGRETILSALGPSGAVLSWYTASYDAVGNRLSVLELDGGEVGYVYVPTDQLTNEQRTGANAYDTTYSYDPVGNRLTKNDGGRITTCSYNAGNELTLLTPPSGAPTTSTYDANGNLLTENAGGALTTYSWDWENRLTGVSSPSETETYSYSADRMREEKENSAGTVHYVRDGENVLIETDAGLVTQAHYTDFPGVGGGLTSERRGGVSGATINPLRFGRQVGYWRDKAERLNVGRRVLRVDQGRWMSQDPLGFGGGDWNLYGYVGNAPLVLQIDQITPISFGDERGPLFGDIVGGAIELGGERIVNEIGTIGNRMEHGVWDITYGCANMFLLIYGPNIEKCANCDPEIFAAWYPSWQHKCNHPYTH